MGVKTVMIPANTHGYLGDEIPMFTPETVEYAMSLVLGR